MFHFIRNYSRLHRSYNQGSISFDKAASAIKLIQKRKMFDGEQNIYAHLSKTQNALMTFGAYLPPRAVKENIPCPVLYYLGDLGETHEKFIKESGAQRWASKYGVILVNPDTSPRNIKKLANYQDWNIGEGASFFVNATQLPWCRHFRMYSYVTQELVDIVHKCLPVIEDNQSICGFGIGGHAALVCALRFWRKYRSVSAFAPMASIVHSPLAQLPITAYLGPRKEDWKEYDASYLASNYCGCGLNVLYDQGTADAWLKDGILMPELFLKAVTKNGRLPLTYVMRDGYDHSYYFVSSFMEEHLAFHTKSLYNTVEDINSPQEDAEECEHKSKEAEIKKKRQGKC